MDSHLQEARPPTPLGIHTTPPSSTSAPVTQSTHQPSHIDTATISSASSPPPPSLELPHHPQKVEQSTTPTPEPRDTCEPDTMMDSYHGSEGASSSSTLSLASDSPITTPGSGSENGDPRTFGFNDVGDIHNHIGLEPTGPGSSRYILVIGGLGFIGSHTSLELLKHGYNVIIVDNLSNSYSDVLFNIEQLASKYCAENGRPMPALRFHKLDYQSRDMQFLLSSYSKPVPSPAGEGQRAAGMTYRSQIAGVIHFAAYKSVSESIGSPLEYYENNVCGLVGLLRQLAEFNIRSFVFSSSATVYGTKANAGKLLREEDIVHHEETFHDECGNEVKAEPTMVGLTSPYARSKYFAEAILADVAASDPLWRIVSLRYFNPIGCDPSGLIGESPRQTPTNLFPVIAQVLTGDRTHLDIFGRDWSTTDGTPVRDFIHVSDIARGHIAALGAQCDAPFRAYNLGSGTGTTVHEAVRSLEEASGKQISINWAGRRAGDVGFCVASNERASRELGWSPRESIAKCARDLWNYVRRIDEASK